MLTCFATPLQSQKPKILLLLLLPPLNLLHSLHWLDAIQMLFFSTPLWRKSTPIVHKINPQVAADPALCVKHAGTLAVCDFFSSSSFWRAHDCAEFHVAWRANVRSNTCVWENPSSEENARTHPPSPCLHLRPSGFPLCVFLLLFFKGQTLQARS